MKKFLVVIDMQNDFVDGALGTKEALIAAENAKDIIRDFDGEVFVTYDTHGEGYLESAEGKKLPVKHCIDGTDGHKLHPIITGALEGKAFTEVKKYTFGSVKLPKILLAASGGEDFSITLIGLCTDICVISNALLLKANFPNNKISVIERGCAGVTPESHDAAITTMKMCQIDII